MFIWRSNGDSKTSNINVWPANDMIMLQDYVFKWSQRLSKQRPLSLSGNSFVTFETFHIYTYLYCIYKDLAAGTAPKRLFLCAYTGNTLYGYNKASRLKSSQERWDLK